jgi:hypothetical protein
MDLHMNTKNNAFNLPASIQNEDFDTHFKVFHELMSIKVFEILLVASPYDAYILEEDGSLASKIINEYRGLNLSRPPRITQAATAARPWTCWTKNRSTWLSPCPTWMTWTSLNWVGRSSTPTPRPASGAPGP